MTNSLTALALVLVLAGSVTAQQKPSRRTTKAPTKSGSAGTISPVDAARSNPSAANTHDGTMGASAGTGTTLEQNQASSSTTSRPTSVDPSSSTRTSAPPTKARKKPGKS